MAARIHRKWLNMKNLDTLVKEMKIMGNTMTLSDIENMSVEEKPLTMETLWNALNDDVVPE